MRTIKFRAWDDKNKKMVLPPPPYSSNPGESMTFDGRVYHNGVYQEYIFMQYFDQNDKNGVEIYEGDILKTDEAGWIAEVIFEEGTFILLDHKGGYSMYPIWEKCEVLGNVYENPDILKLSSGKGIH